MCGGAGVKDENGGSNPSETIFFAVLCYEFELRSCLEVKFRWILWDMEGQGEVGEKGSRRERMSGFF